MKNPEFAASMVLTIITVFVIAIWVPGKGEEKIGLAIAYGGLVILFLLGFMVLSGIASGKIDISQLLSEKDGSGASMSRFQLMIFTFVIALSFFLIVASTGKFPDKIPTEVLTLLGISATTYGVSKGIQAGANDKNSDDESGNSADSQPVVKTSTTTTSNIPPR